MLRVTIIHTWQGAFETKGGCLYYSKGPQPLISVYMKLKVRAIDVKSADELSSGVEECTGKKLALSFWVESNAQDFKEELELCFQEPSKNFIGQLFVWSP